MMLRSPATQAGVPAPCRWVQAPRRLAASAPVAYSLDRRDARLRSLISRHGQMGRHA